MSMLCSPVITCVYVRELPDVDKFVTSFSTHYQIIGYIVLLVYKAVSFTKFGLLHIVRSEQFEMYAPNKRLRRQRGKDLVFSDKTENPCDETGPIILLNTVTNHIGKPASLLKEIAFVAVVCCAQLMTQAGLAQAIAPLDIIGDSFGIQSPGELSWFAAGYSLTVGTFILIAGRLGDLYGHKKLFVLGFLWYSLWSLLAGFSVYSNRIFFDCCRAFQGLGPALLLPNALAIFGRIYEPGRRKNFIFSLFGATAPSGFVLGATFSSIFSQLLWWPWSYWVMSIACLALAISGIVVIPHTPSPNKVTSVVKQIDLMGGVTGVIGLILVNFAWNQGPVVGWPTPYTYVLLIVGILFLVLFAFIESRAEYPLVPLQALSRDSIFVLACVGTGWSSFGIWLFYLWRFLQGLRGVTPLLASAQVAPVAISGLCAAITTGHALAHYPPSSIMLFAMTAFTVGCILICTAPVHQSYWAQTFVSIIVMPWGMDMSFPAATIMLSNCMPHEHQGLAASLVNTMVNYSISLGLGFAGTIESRVNDGGQDVLSGYRGAWYMGVGLSGLGVCVAAAYALHTLHQHKGRNFKV
ncbi:LADA_0G02696g1_1 [Lachancea dasiensis]|uniref:LADA_0G02696g1_1 n=1 Tax=Lachancea dasiensis TaxID=1072105 RepID=A0A1G4JRC7_9SACH|nr:LADA_0G02696g1_1 [Lachancea dasiensis]